MKDLESTKSDLMSIKGVQISCLHSGIKKSKNTDLVLIFFEQPVVVAGCFTKNIFAAAPVGICKEKVDNFVMPIQGAFLINSGCANACTGEIGFEDCFEIINFLAQEIELNPDQILPFSTGPIMERLPKEKIQKHIPALVKELGHSNWSDAALAIMTTDTFPKEVTKNIELSQGIVNITAIAKGSGMICPNMATMLVFIVTDAVIENCDLSNLVEHATKNIFNNISVDGDTSTNDSFVAAANGVSGVYVGSKNKKFADDWIKFKSSFFETCEFLAKSIVRDGEGATKFITLEIKNALSNEEVNKIGNSIANSPLVKTAFFASDPNLGRILAAIGNAGLQNFETKKLKMSINGYTVFVDGNIVKDYSEFKAKKEMVEKEIVISVDLRRGKISGVFYTCDLSYDYVSINSDYRT